ncbi:hypothetical protein Gotur_023996 [Gossypium turneri]
MASSLIRFDDKHIFVAQAIMVDDHVLEGFIHKLSKSPDTEIRSYLQDAGFLHASCMLRGCNLHPTVISPLVERWRPEMHTFYLPCSECTITLEDVALQLGLRVNGPMLPTPTTVMGVVAVTISTSSSEQPLYVPIGDKVEPWAELHGTIGIAQRYPAIFESMSYVDPDIIECVSLEFFVIQSMQDAKVSLIVYATTNKNWRDYHNKYINIWDRTIEFLPICELVFSSDTVACLEYIPWFRVVGKSYLLSVKCRSKGGDTTKLSPTPTQQVPPTATPYLDQFTPLILAHFTNPIFFPQVLHYTPPQHLTYTPLVDAFFGAPPSPTFYAPMPTLMPTQMSTQLLTHVLTLLSSSMTVLMLTSMPTYPGFTTSYDYSLIVSQTPIATTLHSSTKKSDRDKGKAKGGDEDEDDGGEEDEYESRGKDEEDEDDDHNKEDESTPQLVRRNPTCNYQPLPVAHIRPNDADDIFFIYFL